VIFGIAWRVDRTRSLLNETEKSEPGCELLTFGGRKAKAFGYGQGLEETESEVVFNLFLWTDSLFECGSFFIPSLRACAITMKMNNHDREVRAEVMENGFEESDCLTVCMRVG
jgi:hypothetical protein